jgi:hypothetical protein
MMGGRTDSQRPMRRSINRRKKDWGSRRSARRRKLLVLLVQARYCYGPRHNTQHLSTNVRELLQEHGLLPLARESSRRTPTSSSHPIYSPGRRWF